MSTLPPGFVTLHDAYETVGSDKPCSVIAVVVDSLPRVKSRKDWMVKITLSDQSGFPGLGAPFRFFNAEEQKLPPFGSKCENGDVVIIRNMKVKDFGGVIGLTNNLTEWAIIDGSSLAASMEDKPEELAIIQSAGGKLGPPTTAELLYAKQVLDMIDPSKIQMPAPRTSLEIANTVTASGGMAIKPKDKFSLIKDIMPPTQGGMIFKDLLGEVRRIYKTDTRMSIYVTDYTSHDLLYDYTFGHDDEGRDGDRFNYVQETTKTWPGPHGKKTILVTLWDAHAVFAHRELHEGHYVLLKNVHIKMDHNGSILEGHCRGDKMNMAKVNLTIVKPTEAESNIHLRELLRRKRTVEKAEGPRFARDPTNVKRRAEAMSDGVNEATVSANAARNKKKRNRKRGKKSTAMDIMEDSDESEPKSKPETGPVFSANTEVRILNVAVPSKPIYEILDREILARKTAKNNSFYLPFQNCRYKSQVRVVDFFPNDLANFSAPYRESDYCMLSDQDDSDSDIDTNQLDNHDVKWEWRFFLVVEDASLPSGQQAARMELLVSDDDGDYLLNMEACDLKKNLKVLSELKEKLFVLWGDLQELKEEANKIQEEVPEFKPRARPFECLITEYGIGARDEDGIKKGNDEYERIFRLCGTTVK